MQLDIHDWELKLADDIAIGIGKKWRRVQVDDVKSELRMWLCENHKYLVRWRDEGVWGRNKLRASLRRRANKFCRQEWETVKPWTKDYEYTPEACAALLEAVFAYDDWTEITSGDSDVWASLADVSQAFETLSVVDRQLLRLRLEEGCRFAEIAERMELASPDAARMRVNRALSRVAERSSQATVRWPAHLSLRPKSSAWLNGETGGLE